MLGLIWIQTVSHSGGILKFIFEKVINTRQQKSIQNSPAYRELKPFCFIDINIFLNDHNFAILESCIYIFRHFIIVYFLTEKAQI